MGDARIVATTRLSLDRTASAPVACRSVTTSGHRTRQGSLASGTGGHATRCAGWLVLESGAALERDDATQRIAPNEQRALLDSTGSTAQRAACANFDLPDHFLPEFPPPKYLTTRPPRRFAAASP